MRRYVLIQNVQEYTPASDAGVRVCLGPDVVVLEIYQMPKVRVTMIEADHALEHRLKDWLEMDSTNLISWEKGS